MKIYIGNDAKELVYQGAKELYDAVRVTLGPKGRNFIVAPKHSKPYLTHDGVTVAKNAEFEGLKEVGASFVRNAALKNAGEIGDGTTSTTILTYSLLDGCKDSLLNSMVLSKQLQEEADSLVEQLTPLKETNLESVATLSSASKEIGSVVAKAVETVGEDGSIVIEPSQSFETELELIEGFKINKGFISPYMANDDTGHARYENIPVLMLQNSLVSPDMITGVLEHVASNSKKLCIVADEISKEIVARLVMLAKRGVEVVAIKTPEIGQRRIEVMKDIQSIVGGQIVKETPTVKDLGLAQRLVCDSESTVFTGTVPEERIEELQKMLQTAPNERSAKFISDRIAGLKGKIAIIHVGGNSEQEIEEKIYRVEDAVGAAKAAVSQGVVVGGALSYLNLKTSDTEAGQIFKTALEKPFRQLMINAGLDDEEKINQVTDTHGIDVMNPDTPVDLVKQGIVDPLSVVSAAIKTSAALASQLITMGGVIVDEKEEE